MRSVVLFACVLGCAHAPRGSTASLRFTKRHLMINPSQTATIGDLDRDGHPDIVYGAYYFAGPDFVPRAFRIDYLAKETIRANSSYVFDVDGDGWPDILEGTWDVDGLYWYKNPGNSAAARGTPWEMHNGWERHFLGQTRGKMELFDLHDFDGDGRPEFYSANYKKGEPLEVFRFSKGPDGAWQLTPFVLGVEGGGHGFAFGDVNNDGREDILTENGWFERPPGDPFAGPWKLHPESALPHPSCPFVVKDWNGDGRLDIVFGKAHDYGLFWWEQLPPKADGTTVWKEHLIDRSWSQAHAIALADLDGDGVEELIAGKCVWAHNGADPGAADPAVLFYYKWDRRTASFERHTIAGPGEGIGLGRQFAVADVNGDGRPDIAAPTKLGLWLILNNGY